MSNVATSLSTDDVARPVMARRRWTLAWWPSVALVCALAAVLWIVRLRGPIDLRYDAGVYYVLGTSLATGQGYRIISEPGSPVGVQYPPGLPAFVALHQKILGTTDPAVVGPVLRLTYCTLFFGFAIAALAVARRYAGPIGGFIATAICLAQANTYLLSDLLFTELPYTLLSLGLVLWLGSERMKQQRGVREAGGFLLATAGFLLRTAGLALLFAWVVEALGQRQWRTAISRALLAALPFVLWQVHVIRTQSSEHYRQPAYEYQRAPYQYYNVSYGENLSLIDPFKPELGKISTGALIKRMGSNLLALPASIGEVVSEAAGFWSAAIDRALGRPKITGTDKPGVGNVSVWTLGRVPLFLLAAISLLGLVVLLARREWFVVSFCGASILLVCSTPWPGQFLRYLAPLCPFLAISTVVGAETIMAWSRRRGSMPYRLAVAGIGILGVMTAGVQAYAVFNSFQVRHHSVVVEPHVPKGLLAPKWFYHDRTWTDWGAAVAWIGSHAKPDAVVATDSPHLCFLRTGRRAVLPPMTPDRAEMRRLLSAVPVSFVIVDELEFLDLTRRYVAPALLEKPEDWQVVFRIHQTAVYANVATKAVDSRISELSLNAP